MFSDTEHRIRLDRLEKTSKYVGEQTATIDARTTQLEKILRERTRIDRAAGAMAGLYICSESYDVKEVVELLLSHLGLKLEKVKGTPETARLAPLDTINVRKPKAYKKRVKK